MIYINQPVQLVGTTDDVMYDVPNVNYVDLRRMDDCMLTVTYDDMQYPKLTALLLSPFGESFVVTMRQTLDLTSRDVDEHVDYKISEIQYKLAGRADGHKQDVYVNVPDTFMTDLLTALQRHDLTNDEIALVNLYLYIGVNMFNTLRQDEQSQLTQAISQADERLNPVYWLVAQRKRAVNPRLVMSALVHNEQSPLRPLSQNVFMKQVAYTAQSWVTDERANYVIDTDDQAVPSKNAQVRFERTIATERLGSEVNETISVLIDPNVTTETAVIAQLKQALLSDFFVTVFDNGQFLEIQARVVKFNTTRTVLLLPYNYVVYAMQSPESMQTTLISQHNEYQQRFVTLKASLGYDFNGFSESRYARGLVPVFLTNATSIKSAGNSDELKTIIKHIH